MMKNLFKKLSRQEEPEDLDTGYQHDYYNGAYPGDNRNGAQPVRPENARPAGAPANGGRGYDEPEYRGARAYEDDRAAYGREPTERSVSYEPEGGRGYGAYNEPDAPGYREPAYARPSVREVAKPVNAGTLYYTPESYKDCRESIVTGLSESHVVVVNIRNLERADLVRLLDYVMGAAQALESEMSRVNVNNLLFCPKGVEIDEEDILIEDQEEYDDEEYEDEEYDEDAYEDEEYEDEEAYDEEDREDDASRE